MSRRVLPLVALRILVSIVLLALAPADAWAQARATAPPAGSTVVYATRTGEKYHRGTCRYLSRSKIPVTLADAVLRLGPCSVCKPPTLGDSTKAAVVVQATPQPTPTPPADSGQCQAITKKGTQCSRRAQAGSSYCWQHQR